MFDVLDQMVQKEVTKTDTGDTRIMGVVVGTVTKNYDRNMPGRVCVTIPTRDENANELKWARVAMPWGGSKWGAYFMPEVGDEVLIAFEQGNIERPYVVGTLYKDSDALLTGSIDEYNQYKKIVTKHGNTLYLEDNREGEGTKDKIRLTTATGAHTLELDNENSMIRLSDKEKKNEIRLDTKNGKMEIDAAASLTIKVGDKVEITLDGNSGEVKINATKFTADIKNELSMSGNSTMKLKSGSLSVEAKGSLKLASSGAVQVSGTPIKIG